MTELTKDKPTSPQALRFQRKKKLERDIEHITEEMYRHNKDLADTNKTLSLLRMIDALVLEPQVSLKAVCQRITEAITSVTDYPFAGLFTRTLHVSNELTLYGHSAKHPSGEGLNLDFAEALHLSLDMPWFSDSQNGRLVSLENLPPNLIAGYLQCSTHQIDNSLKRLPLKSVYVVKLRVRRHLVGLMVIGFLSAAESLSATEMSLLDRLSETIGVAIDNKLLFEENTKVLKQLKESNAKLLALDEAKDDFISMASHQLRTPLTSVKGYLSMVMEEDVGKITPAQKTMLNQAFVSCQRMVFIIADLLNVSRLRTGKFVINPTPINLDSVVQDELTQLSEIAKSRDITIGYTPVKSFPELMLDEAKTRQVIMNFIDNAIYYTANKGKITVTLTDKPKTIELTVKDNGMGVPKSEQHHLFTKFYRASNARKARPDGTGLGLYMSKKVIIAQGGSLIFSSEEGKGSTFGFILSKAKLPLTPIKPS